MIAADRALSSSARNASFQLPNTVVPRMVPKRTVEDLERVMLDMEQAECPVTHHFGPGVYVREVRMKAGTFAVGHHQNGEHLNVFISGKVLMFREDGTTQVLTAPMTFVGKPGRKVGLILEDVIWQNVYATDERDVEKLEARFITKSDTWTADQAQRLALARVEIPRVDYAAVLSEFGIPHETALAVSRNEADLVEIPLTTVQVAPSPIDGRGLFATSAFAPGDVIAPARVGGKRTQAGRYTNHSPAPNARMVARGAGVDLVAIAPIAGCRGGQLGDEITIDYREALRLSGLEPKCQQ
ncbi:hypothetical protein [Ferrovum sp.]|uniref:hypothetical protein n=1 Tax=Ferrovum sp. TaxID=2609467 RepID=UPI002619449E|nr:hypothetical protein [Ferrovum sp.]